MRFSTNTLMIVATVTVLGTSAFCLWHEPSPLVHLGIGFIDGVLLGGLWGAYVMLQTVRRNYEQ